MEDEIQTAVDQIFRDMCSEESVSFIMYSDEVETMKARWYEIIRQAFKD